MAKSSKTRLQTTNQCTVQYLGGGKAFLPVPSQKRDAVSAAALYLQSEGRRWRRWLQRGHSSLLEGTRFYCASAKERSLYWIMDEVSFGCIQRQPGSSPLAILRSQSLRKEKGTAWTPQLPRLRAPVPAERSELLSSLSPTVLYSQPWLPPLLAGEATRGSSARASLLFISDESWAHIKIFSL